MPYLYRHVLYVRKYRAACKRSTIYQLCRELTPSQHLRLIEWIVLCEVYACAPNGKAVASKDMSKTDCFFAWKQSDENAYASSQAVLTLFGAAMFESHVIEHEFDSQVAWLYFQVAWHSSSKQMYRRSSLNKKCCQFREVFLIAVTCILAMLLNVTTFGIIGKTSPTTFQVFELSWKHACADWIDLIHSLSWFESVQVVGHAKTCLLIAWGLISKPRWTLSTTEVSVQTCVGEG